MSRSFKKNAILKDGGSGRKKLAHHKTRMVVRNLLNSKLDYDELLFPTRKAVEINDPWDICDWITRFPHNQEYWFHYYNQGKRIWHKITKADLRKYRSK